MKRSTSIYEKSSINLCEEASSTLQSFLNRCDLGGLEICSQKSSTLLQTKIDQDNLFGYGKVESLDESSSSSSLFHRIAKSSISRAEYKRLVSLYPRDQSYQELDEEQEGENYNDTRCEQVIEDIYSSLWNSEANNVSSDLDDVDDDPSDQSTLSLTNGGLLQNIQNTHHMNPSCRIKRIRGNVHASIVVLGGFAMHVLEYTDDFEINLISRKEEEEEEEENKEKEKDEKYNNDYTETLYLAGPDPLHSPRLTVSSLHRNNSLNKNHHTATTLVSLDFDTISSLCPKKGYFKNGQSFLGLCDLECATLVSITGQEVKWTATKETKNVVTRDIFSDTDINTLDIVSCNHQKNQYINVSLILKNSPPINKSQKDKRNVRNMTYSVCQITTTRRYILSSVNDGHTLCITIPYSPIPSPPFSSSNTSSTKQEKSNYSSSFLSTMTRVTARAFFLDESLLGIANVVCPSHDFLMRMIPRLENVNLINPSINNRVVEIIANVSSYQGLTLPVILLIEPVNVATVWSGLSVKETSLKNKTRSSLISPSGLQTLSGWFRNVICESETNLNSNKQFTNTIVSTSITRLSQTMKPSLKTTSNRIDNTLVSEDIDISSQILTHEALPKHIAVVMDGNGRWAKNRGLSRSEGHRAGVNAIHGLIRACRRLRIPFLTLYAFSSQNWARPMQEVETLMTLLAEFVEKDLEELCANGVRLLVNGDIARLPNRARSGLERMVEASRSNSAAGLTLCLALSYGGREEIIGGVAAACRAHKAGLLDVSSLTPESFRAAFLPHPDVPDPCLLIRTSGELRVSNFLLWQIAYTELYVTPALWPDFNEQELIKALVTFSQRERRFGKTSEQIASEALSSSSSTSSLLVAGAVMLSQSQERSTRYDASVNANVSEQQYKHSNGLKSGVYSWRVLVVLSLVCLFIVLLLVLFVMNYYFSSTSLLSSMSTPTSSTSPLIHLSSQTPWPIPGPTVGKHHKTREL